MKMSIILLCGLYLIIYSCDLISEDSKKKILPGTYIRISENEYGHEYDTIIVSLINQATSEYRITHKWKFERVIDGQQIEPEYKIQVKSGIFDAKAGFLTEAGTSDQFSFNSEQKLMINGPNHYHKID